MYVSLGENRLDEFISDVKLHSDDLRMAEIVDHGQTSLDSKIVRATVKKLREVKLTVHCPFDPSSNISNPNIAHRKIALDRLKLSIDHAVEIGAVGFVQHPGSKVYAYDKHSEELNDAALLELIDYGNSRGLKVGIENMPRNVGYLSTPDEFDEFFKNNNMNAQIVFDTGHANMGGNLEEFVKNYSSKFLQLHVTDNDGRSDRHMNVGTGTIDWRRLISQLGNNGFKGAYVIESIDKPLDSLPVLKRLLNERPH
jgi:sugar phosphate isomerase/epimerase